MFFYLIQGLALGLSAAVSPGPFQAFLLAQTLRLGWRRSIWAALAPLLSDGPIILLVLLILTQMPGWVLAGVQIAGGFFILYLAWGAWQVYRQKESDLNLSPESGQQSFFKAVLVNGLSPNPFVFWSTIAGPIVLEGWRQTPALGLSFMLGFYLALTGGFAGFVLLFALAGRLGPRITRLLNGVSALALLIFGLYQIGKGLSLLW